MAIEVAALAEKLIKTLTKKSCTLAVAESCTGGHIADCLTDVSGASAVFLGSLVTYSNELKKNILGVPEIVLRDFGAVSAECARAMVEGLYQKTGADCCVAVTGIAGPTGGTAEKPVGTVFVAWHFSDRKDDVLVEQHHFPLPRRDFKDAVARIVFEKLLENW